MLPVSDVKEVHGGQWGMAHQLGSVAKNLGSHKFAEPFPEHSPEGCPSRLATKATDVNEAERQGSQGPMKDARRERNLDTAFKAPNQGPQLRREGRAGDSRGDREASTKGTREARPECCIHC